MSIRSVQTSRPAEAALTRVPPTRVAIVITRLEGGAGALAVHGAVAMDPAEFQTTIITGSGDALTDRARAAGIEVIVEP
ncbi:MAG TPA: hypothetical protein VMB74_18485, partial [Streptosporangiaceae bacterium]|nr:hypothetical protein [Streptosporangiaceae bacterium]